MRGMLMQVEVSLIAFFTSSTHQSVSQSVSPHRLTCPAQVEAEEMKSAERAYQAQTRDDLSRMTAWRMEGPSASRGLSAASMPLAAAVPSRSLSPGCVPCAELFTLGRVRMDVYARSIDTVRLYSACWW
jgi:hypothetical protein